jgi:hypothetical protein
MMRENECQHNRTLETKIPQLLFSVYKCHMLRSGSSYYYVWNVTLQNVTFLKAVCPTYLRVYFTRNGTLNRFSSFHFLQTPPALTPFSRHSFNITKTVTTKLIKTVLSLTVTWTIYNPSSVIAMAYS